MFPEFQSAYRKYHSTETALLRMRNDILVSMNKQQVTLLVFLDLSAAFDTVDHDILLRRLEYKFGIKDQAVTWFKSYLSNRSQDSYIGETSRNLSTRLTEHTSERRGMVTLTITLLSTIYRRNIELTGTLRQI